MHTLFEVGEPVAAVASDGAFATRQGTAMVLRDRDGREVFRVADAGEGPFDAVAPGGRAFARASSSAASLTVWEGPREQRTVDVGDALEGVYAAAGLVFAR